MKEYPSDALVDGVFNILKEKDVNFRYYNFHDLENFVDENFKGKEFFEEEQRKFFDKYEKEIKNMIRTKPLDDEIFNLNHFSISGKQLVDYFFCNSEISLEEKQKLINEFAIRPYKPFWDVSKSVTNKNLIMRMQLSPIEDLFNFYKKLEEYPNKLKIVKEYNPEITKAIEESISKYEDYFDQKESVNKYLFENFDHIAGVSSYSNKFEPESLGYDFFYILKKGFLYNQYNVNCAESMLYRKVHSLKGGGFKEDAAYYEWDNKARENPGVRWHTMENIQDDVIEKMHAQYPVKEIVNLIGDVYKENKINEDNLRILENFLTGFDVIDSNHYGQTYLFVYKDYFKEMFENEKLKNFLEVKETSFGTMANHYNLLHKTLKKVLELEGKEIKDIKNIYGEYIR